MNKVSQVEKQHPYKFKMEKWTKIALSTSPGLLDVTLQCISVNAENFHDRTSN